MDSEDQSSAGAKALASRVSVACLPCRNRHVRCDAQQPICIRCSSEGRTCQYVKSRRGGLNRARLAERRRARNPDGGHASSPSSTSAESRSPKTGVAREHQALGGSPPSAMPSGFQDRSPESELSAREEPDMTLNSITDIQFSSVTSDFLVKLYYKYFHSCHPCVLPQHQLQRQYEGSPARESLTLLIAVLRFIGSLYSCPDLTSQLRDKVEVGLQDAKRLPPDVFLAQFHILYSIALYWSGEKDKSREQIDTAIRIAISLGMNRRRCASELGQGDPFLEESLRRTWWQIYCIDAYFAAIKRLPTFTLCEVDADTDLPCEEEEYESGVSSLYPKVLDASLLITIVLY